MDMLQLLCFIVHKWINEHFAGVSVALFVFLWWFYTFCGQINYYIANCITIICKSVYKIICKPVYKVNDL